MAIVTFNSTTINNVLIHKNQLSATDLVKLNANPNLMGKLALETLGATKTIPELDMVMDAGASADSYYMCSEKSGAYLVDSRNIAYGAELLNQDLSNGVWVARGFTKTSIIETDPIGGSTALLITENNTDANPALYYGADTSDGTPQKLEIWLKASTTTTVALNTQGNSNTYSASLTTSWQKFEIIDSIDDLFGVHIGGFSTITQGSGILIYVWSPSLKYITSDVQSIANYTETIRTNADLQQKGIQTTAFVTDDAGVPTAYSDNLLQFNGDGRYVDTKISPPSDKAWEMDYVMYLLANSSSDYSGFFGVSSANRLAISQNINNQLVVEAGASIYTSSVFTEGMVYVRIIFDGLGNFTIDVNNSTVATFIASTYTYSATEVFWLGALSRAGALLSGNEMASPIGTFQYKLGTRTAAERNAYYANLKTIYPTLP